MLDTADPGLSTGDREDARVEAASGGGGAVGGDMDYRRGGLHVIRPQCAQRQV